MPNSPIPFTNLPYVTGLDGTERVPVVQAGTNKTASVAQIASISPTPLTVSGSRGGNAALADLLTQLAALGLIVDGTTV